MSRFSLRHSVIQVEVSFRAGAGAKWFEAEWAWNDTKNQPYKLRLWWTHGLITCLGLTVGVGLWLGCQPAPTASGGAA